jgi:hypothetical protein
MTVAETVAAQGLVTHATVVGELLMGVRDKNELQLLKSIPYSFSSCANHRGRFRGFCCGSLSSISYRTARHGIFGLSDCGNCDSFGMCGRHDKRQALSPHGKSAGDPPLLIVYLDGR